MISRWRNKDKQGGSSSKSSFLPTIYKSTYSSSSYNSPTISSSSSPSQKPSPTSLPYHSHSHSYSRNNKINRVPGHIRPIIPNNNNTMCTNFLMGGQYYPGKDKKRNLLRRKTLWYRIFCSSNIRRIICIIFCIYVIIGFVIMPTLDVIYDYGNWLSKRDYTFKNNGVGVGVGVDHVVMDDTLLKQEGEEEEEEEGPKVLPEEENVEKVKDDDHDFEEREGEVVIQDDQEVDKQKIENVIPVIDNNNNMDHHQKNENSIHDKREEEKEIITKNNNHNLHNNIDKMKTIEMLKEEAKVLDENIEQMQNNVDRTTSNISNEKNDILKDIVGQEFYDAATKKDEIVIIQNKDESIKSSNSDEKNDGNNDKLEIKEKVEKVEKADTTADTTISIHKETKYIERNLRNQNQHYTYSSCPKEGTHKVSISLVLQTTFDRLKLLNLTCQRWRASPIIISIYMTQNEYETQWDDTLKEYYTTLCNDTTIFLPYISTSNEERTLRYPINRLRNQALDRVITSHVLVMDIDMIPSDNLDSAILDSIALAIAKREDDDGDASLDPLDAIVVPAFERKLTGGLKCDTMEDCQTLIHENEKFIPNNIEELKKNIVNEECVVFQSEENWEGHHSTNTNAWIESSFDPMSKNKLRVIQCFDSLRYEPYVVIPWCALKSNAEKLIMKRPGPRSPYYDERFYGYGKNKIQQIAHLRKKGYQFMVMPPTGFITHFPHPISQTKKIWNDKKSFDLHDKMDRLYPKYLDELERVYDNYFEHTKLCTSRKT